jgi:WD40 repeat protein
MADLQLQELLIGHDGDVTTVAASPNGALIASGQMGVGPSKDAPIIVWNATSHVEVTRLLGHSGSVTSVAFSPDARYIASVDEAGRMSIWDAASGVSITGAKLDQPASTVVWMAMDPGRSRTPSYTLATVGSNSVRLHRLAFDPRAMQYTMTIEAVSMPSGLFIRAFQDFFGSDSLCGTGMQRSFVCAAAFGGGQWLVAGSNTSDACIFDMVNKIFRAQLPVPSIRLCFLFLFICLRLPPGWFERSASGC